MSTQSKIISYEDLKPVKGISYSRMQLSRLMKDGKFPAKVQISSKRIGWLEHEIDAWIAKKVKARPAIKQPT